jgi:hypothetical protein
MKIKKLNSSRLSFKLDYEEADQVANIIMSYLETESVNIRSVKKEKDPARWLMYYTIHEMYRKHSGKLLGAGPQHNYIIECSEALALVWLFKDVPSKEINAAFQLKQALYQKIV